MRNPLQDQLLKAGLVKKDKVAQVVREQARQRQGRAAAEQDTAPVDVQRLLAERAEHDRALSAERNAQMHASEQVAQARQIVDAHKIEKEGDIDYRFLDAGKIRSVRVNELLRSQLASGLVVIARLDDGYELLPRRAAEKVSARSADAIVLDHGNGKAALALDENADEYRQFAVPDDLIW